MQCGLLCIIKLRWRKTAILSNGVCNEHLLGGKNGDTTQSQECRKNIRRKGEHDARLKRREMCIRDRRFAGLFLYLNIKKPRHKTRFFIADTAAKMEAPPRFELGVRALQAPALPLGYGAIWSGRRDSNPRHSPWQGDTLPLSHSRKLVPQSGIEPPTQGFSVPCSTD